MRQPISHFFPPFLIVSVKRSNAIYSLIAHSLFLLPLDKPFYWALVRGSLLQLNILLHPCPLLQKASSIPFALSTFCSQFSLRTPPPPILLPVETVSDYFIIWLFQLNYIKKANSKVKNDHYISPTFYHPQKVNWQAAILATFRQMRIIMWSPALCEVNCLDVWSLEEQRKNKSETGIWSDHIILYIHVQLKQINP